MATEAQPILFCACAHRDFVPADAQATLLAGLSQYEAQVTVVDDLCGLAAHRDPVVTGLAQFHAPIIIACHPRAVRWLLHAAGLDPRKIAPRILNLRTTPPATLLAELSSTLECAGAPRREVLRHAVPSPDRWVPWFPAIDYDRCVNCRQCVSFCPFGVYTALPNKVTVSSPRNCKDNCPACARVCPEQAIVFPKVADAPINGAEVTEENVLAARRRHAAQAADLAKGDLHAALANRKLRVRPRSSTVPGTPP